MLNLIRSTQDWRILVQTAIAKKINSRNPRVVQQFIDDMVEGSKEKRAAVFAELMAFLREIESAVGIDTGPKVIDLGRKDS